MGKKQEWISAHCPRKKIVEVHERTEECRDAGERPEDKAKSDGNLPIRDEVGKKNRMKHSDISEKIPIP